MRMMYQLGRGCLRRLAVGLSLALVGTAVAACGSSSSTSSSAQSAGSSPTVSGSTTPSTASTPSASTSKPSGTPFTYLVVLDLTGPSKVYGPGQEFSSQTAATYLNDTRGGILGHPVKVTIVNDNGDPGTAVSTIDQYLSSHPKPNLVYPGSVSDEIAATLPVVTRAGLFTIANEQGVPGTLSKDAATKYPLQFTTVFPTAVPAQRAAQWFQSRGIKKVGIAAVDSPYDLGDASVLSSVLKQEGIASTQVTIPPSSIDPTPELAKLKSAGLGALYCGCLGPAVGYALAARHKLGWDTPVLGSLAASAQDITKLVPKSDLNGVYELTSREDTAQYSSLVASKYLVAHGFAQKAGIAPMSVAGNAWDPLILAANAATRAKSITPSAMAKVLVSAPGSGICDNAFLLVSCYRFSDGNHVPSYPPSSFSVVPAGPVVNGLVQ